MPNFVAQLFSQALCAVLLHRDEEWTSIVRHAKLMLECKAVVVPCSYHLVKGGDSWRNCLLHQSARLETKHGAQTAGTSAHALGKPLHVWLTLPTRPFYVLGVLSQCAIAKTVCCCLRKRCCVNARPQISQHSLAVW